MRSRRPLPVLPLLVLFAAFPASSRAKVVFTGYADLRATLQSDSKIRGSDAVLAAFGVSDRRGETRSFTVDTLGLFATTAFDEKTDFLLDVTYKNIGATAGETRLQYAYVHYHPSWELKAGRVTLPIGIYNENYFYPFQRYFLTPPIFQGSVLGMPIADQGVILSDVFSGGGVALHVSAYAVNGYGPSRSSTDTFRAAAGAVSDALVIANNIRASNTGGKLAYGGNVGLAAGGAKAGVSSYNGAWSNDGKRDFSILNGYFTVEARRLRFLAEWTRTDTDNDGGVAATFGVRDWTSQGGFLQAAVRVYREGDREVALFAGTEDTIIKGKGAGASGRERLVYHRLGGAWRRNANVMLKLELSALDYKLPRQLAGGVQQVNLVSRSAIVGVVITY